MKSSAQRQEIKLYIQRAERMLKVAEHNLQDRFFDSSVNRSYYAVFYAASALLTTKDLAMKRHSGVISAFREHFVKTGIFAVEYSDVYGRLLDHRETSDYELVVTIDERQAKNDLQDAQRFVLSIQAWLKQEEWL